MSKDKFFFLNREYIFCKGKQNFAVYDLFKGNIIALDQYIGIVVDMAEQGNTISEISDKSGLKRSMVINCLDQLKNNNIGEYYSNRIFIEKYRTGNSLFTRTLQPVVIHSAYIEMPGQCTLDCGLCDYPTLFQCNSCKRASTNFDLDNVNLFFDRVSRINCHNVIIHGGDPLTNPENVFSFAQRCRVKNYNGTISIITNGTQLNETLMQKCKDYQIHLVIPLFSPLYPNELQYFQVIPKLAVKYGVSFTIATTLSEKDVQKQQEIDAYINQFHPLSKSIALVYNEKPHLEDTVFDTHACNPLRVSAIMLDHMKRAHPCLWGTIALTASGDILPCPYLSGEIVGNVNESYWFERMFEDNVIYDYWELPISSLEMCSDCAFRYGCNDCRAFEKTISGDLYGKVSCNYLKKRISK